MSRTELQQISDDRWVVVDQATGFRMGELAQTLDGTWTALILTTDQVYADLASRESAWALVEKLVHVARVPAAPGGDSVMAAMQAKADGDLEWWRKAPIGGGCHAEGCDESPAPGDDCSQEHYSDALQDAVLDAILYCVGVGEMPDLDDVEPWLWYDLYRREGEIRRSAERMEEMAMDEVPWVMDGGAL